MVSNGMFLRVGRCPETVSKVFTAHFAEQSLCSPPECCLYSPSELTALECSLISLKLLITRLSGPHLQLPLTPSASKLSFMSIIDP